MWLQVLGVYARPRLLLVGLGLSIAAEIALVTLLPLLAKELIDTAVSSPNATAFVLLGFLLLVVLLIGGAGGVAREHISSALAARALTAMRDAMYVQVNRLPLVALTRLESGDVLAHFSTDSSALETALEDALPRIAYAAVGTLVGVALLVLLDWRLAVVTLATFPFAAVGPQMLGGPALLAGEVRAVHEQDVLLATQEALSGQRVIRVFGLRAQQAAGYRERLADLERATWRAAFFGRLLSRTAFLGLTFGQAMIILVGALLVFFGNVTVGTLVGFTALLVNVSAMLDLLSQGLPLWVKATAGMRRIMALLASTTDDETDGSPVPAPQRVWKHSTGWGVGARSSPSPIGSRRHAGLTLFWCWRAADSSTPDAMRSSLRRVARMRSSGLTRAASSPARMVSISM